MKGDPKLIKALNALLADELTAINQYMVHSEMCDNWGYDKLHKAIEKRAIDEMKHAEKLIGRILFLEGLPIVSDLKKLFIGADIPKMFANDHAAEDGAIKAYNEAIILAGNRQGLRDPRDPRIHPQGRGRPHRRHRGDPGPDRPDGPPDLPDDPGRLIRRAVSI